MHEILDEPRPVSRIYKEGAIIGATFLGGPIAGGYMLSENFKAFSQPAPAKQAIIFSAITTIVLIVLAALLPDEYSTVFRVLPIAVTIAIARLASNLQGEKIKQHVEKKRPTYPWWWALLIGLLGFGLTVGAIVLLVLLTHNL